MTAPIRPGTDPSAVELGDYLGIIRRRFVVVGVAVAVCLALGLLFTLTRPDVYRSTSEIAMPAATATQTPAQSNADVQTELAVLQSDVVAERAAAAMGDDADPRDLLSHLSVGAPTDARVLRVFFTAATAKAAQRGAEAFTEAYIAVKEEEQQAAIDSQVETYQRRIDALEEGIAEQDRIIAEAEDGSREQRAAEDARDDLASTRSALSQSQAEADSQAIDGGTIITPARLPRQPRATGQGRTVAAALAAGLALGLAAAFVLDRLDTRVRGAADLQQALGVQPLGSIPVFSRALADPAKALVTATAPKGAESDAFRRLRTSVLLALGGDGPHTLMVTSSVADEGKSTVAANLAVAVAQGGRRVLLVGADLRNTGFERMIENAPPTAPGLTDLLRRETTLDLVEHRLGDLTYILPGSDELSPTDLLGSEMMTDAIPALAEGYHLVIFDTPPVLAAADALVLARKVDATLLVVSPTKATVAQAGEALQELRLAGANVLGAVINNDAESSRRAAAVAAYGT